MVQKKRTSSWSTNTSHPNRQDTGLSRNAHLAKLSSPVSTSSTFEIDWRKPVFGKVWKADPLEKKDRMRKLWKGPKSDILKQSICWLEDKIVCMIPQSAAPCLSMYRRNCLVQKPPTACSYSRTTKSRCRNVTKRDTSTKPVAKTFEPPAANLSPATEGRPKIIHHIVDSAPLSKCYI